MEKGLIIKSISGEYSIIKKNQEILVCKPRGVFRYKNLVPKVGDIVELENNTIVAILPRKNELERPFIANVDKLFLVFSIEEPTFNSNLLDRILAINEYRNIESIIIITKLDLLTDLSKYEHFFEYYKKIGYKVFFSDRDIEIIKKEIKDSIAVFAGQTGVGKTTLLNTISGLKLKTSEVSIALGRGKHTTRHVELVRVKDGWIADTPGFGIVDFHEIDALTLSHSFKEFFKYSENCKFSKCTHINEPNCYVKKMVEKNEIISSRYDNYKLFIKEIEETKKNQY